MNLEINYIAVLLASVASMVVGFLWYSPLILGTQWMKLKGYTKEGLEKAQKEMGKLYGISFVVAIITAYMMAHVMGLSINFYQYPKLQTGFTTAIFMWMGFVMPVQVTATIFGDKKWKLLCIDTGYQLVALLAMGVVIGMM